MKKHNYYSIHKNKKKRKSTANSKMEALKIVNRVIRNAIILNQRLIEVSNAMKMIPKYATPNIGNYKRITDDLKIVDNKSNPVIMTDNDSDFNHVVYDYASRSGSNPGLIIAGMDFGINGDKSVEAVINRNGNILNLGKINDITDFNDVNGVKIWHEILDDGKFVIKNNIKEIMQEDFKNFTSKQNENK